MLWVFFTPAILYSRLPVYISAFLDGVVVAIYCYLINISHPGHGWFWGLAVPVIALLTLLTIVFLFLIRTFHTSVLATAIYLSSELAVFCVFLEFFIRGYLDDPLRITWSAVVLACCACIDIVLVTIITRSRLRESVRRRMHL